MSMNITEEILINIAEYISLCKCNINLLNILTKLFPEYINLKKIIIKNMNKNTLKNENIYIKKLNAKNELCIIHDDQIEIDFWTNINKSNLKNIYNKNKYNDKINQNYHDYESLNRFFLHFENIKITSFIADIIERKYYNTFKINGYCCNGKGVCLILL